MGQVHDTTAASVNLLTCCMHFEFIVEVKSEKVEMVEAEEVLVTVDYAVAVELKL